MSGRSALRRSSPPINRFSTVQRFQVRQFSAAASSPESAQSQKSPGDDRKINLLGWISAGIITSSAAALSLHLFSSSPPQLSLADCSAPAAAPTVTALSQISGAEKNSRSNFFFGGKRNGDLLLWFDLIFFLRSSVVRSFLWCFAEAYRRKIFFNYERRIRMRSPPEKVLFRSV